jgi:uncharacterized protein
VGEAGSGTRRAADAAVAKALEKDWKTVAGFLRDHPQFIRNDAELLTELGLWQRADNIVEFGPAALARLSEAKTREKTARQQLEITARANFAAQAQTQAAVVDLLESRNHSDLARRLEEIAQLRFGLVTGVVAIEGPERAPAGWRGLPPGGVDQIMGARALARMGAPLHAELLFSQQAEVVESVALVRVAIWEPARLGLVAFGSPEADGFTPDMGAELVAFLARVVERTAERWPVL